MRSGDPINAKSSKTWTSENKPFASAVTREVPGLQHPAQSFVPKATNEIMASQVSTAQRDHGDFNTGNGGVWPRGYVRA